MGDLLGKTVEEFFKLVFGGLSFTSYTLDDTTDDIKYESRNFGRIASDITHKSFPELDKKDQNPTIKNLVDRIDAEKELKIKSSKKYDSHILEKTYSRAMKGLGRISLLANEAQEDLENMVSTRNKHGEPINADTEDNINIKVRLEKFEEDMRSVMKQQEFHSHLNSFNSTPHVHGIDDLACFNPKEVADQLLKYTRVKLQIRKAGINIADLDSNNGIIAPELPVTHECYTKQLPRKSGILGGAI